MEHFTGDLVNTDLATVLIGALTSFLSQISKKYLGGVSPMLLVAAIAIVLGGGWVVLRQHGVITDQIVQTAVGAFGTAVVIYNIVKAANRAVATPAATTPAPGR